MGPKLKATAPSASKSATASTPNIIEDDSPSQSVANKLPRTLRKDYRKEAGMRAPNKTADEKDAEAAAKEKCQNEEASRKDKARTALDTFESGATASTTKTAPAGARQVKVTRPLAGKSDSVSVSSNMSSKGGVSNVKESAAPTKVHVFRNIQDICC